MNSKSDAAKLAVLMGCFTAGALMVSWLLLALIDWNFDVTAKSVRILLVFSVTAAVVTFVVAKIQNL